MSYSHNDVLLKWWCEEEKMNDPICRNELFYGDTIITLFKTILFLFCKKYWQHDLCVCDTNNFKLCMT